jgi:hypothetical protein
MPAVTAVVDFEITRKLTEFSVPAGHAAALVLVRLHGRPLGWGASPVTDGRLDSGSLVRQLVQQHAWSCALPLAERAVRSGRAPGALDATRMLLSPPQSLSSGPHVTVAVRSRTQASRLRPCLDSVTRIEYPFIDRVLIDASDDRKRVEALVRDQYPDIRYVSAPGLGMVSRRAVAECRGDILALTDGDAVVDAQWVSALVHVFLADPDVMTVSGLVLPRSLRRPFRPTLPAGAPFCRRWWRAPEDWDSIDGATETTLERASSNIAYWRPGSPTSPRHTCVWEPAAIVRAPSSTPTPCPSARRGPLREIDRSVDLADGLTSIGDALADDSIRLQVSWAGQRVGRVRIPHQGAIVSPLWIADSIAQQLTWTVLDAGLGLGQEVARALITADLSRYVLSRWDAELRGADAAAVSRAVDAA